MENTYYEDGWLIWSGNSNSVYGVGSRVPASYTDTVNHRATENIQYVVRRGLLSGTTAPTFAPNTPITGAGRTAALTRRAVPPGPKRPMTQVMQ